jgi:pimeloyl-ACP methyl ester carboxylesterase
VVVVHGTRGSASQWDLYARLLPDVELVAVELPGHGMRVGEAFTAEGALAAVSEAVAGARGRPVVLAGHSLGGYLATLYAATRPAALDSLVLLGASADPTSRLAVVYRAFAWALPQVGEARIARIANAVVRRLGATDAVAQALPDGASYAALPAAWALVMESCGPDLLRQVTCPVILANGQWDQMRLGVRRYAAACADPRVVTIPHATHFAPLTHPERVAAVLREAVALAVDNHSYEGRRGFYCSPAPRG